MGAVNSLSGSAGVDSQGNEPEKQQSNVLDVFQAALDLASGGNNTCKSNEESTVQIAQSDRRDSGQSNLSAASTEYAAPVLSVSPRQLTTSERRESVGRAENKAVKTFNAPVKFAIDRYGSFKESNPAKKHSRKDSLTEQAQRDTEAVRKQRGSFRRRSFKQNQMQPEMSEKERSESVHNLLHRSMSRLM